MHGFQKKLIVVSSDYIIVMLVLTMAYNKYDPPFMLTKAMRQDHWTAKYFQKTNNSLVT